MDNIGWTLFTNHAHILFCLAANPELRYRDIAVQVGVTERAVQRIVAELAEHGYLSVERVGRRNHYRVNLTAKLRHPLEAHHNIGELIAWLGPKPGC